MRRVALTALTMAMMSACAAPYSEADHKHDVYAQVARSEAQRFAYIKPFCPTETMQNWDDSPSCREAKERWIHVSGKQLLAEMRAEHQHGILYNAVAFGLGPIVGAPPPGIEGPTMRYDGYARTMSYGDHDDYVSPLSR